MPKPNSAFEEPRLLLNKIAVIVGARVMQKYNETFKMDDIECLEENFGRSVNTIIAGPYEHSGAPFYLKAEIHRSSGKKSERSIITRLDLELFMQYDVNTPKHTYADAHLSVAQGRREGSGKPNAMEELMYFYFTPHPITAAVTHDISADDLIMTTGGDDSKLNPLAKDLANQVLLHT